MARKLSIAKTLGGVDEEEVEHLCHSSPHGVDSEEEAADLDVEDGEHRRPCLVHERGEELREDVDDEYLGAEHHEDCVDEEEVGHLSQALLALMVLRAVVLLAVPAVVMVLAGGLLRLDICIEEFSVRAAVQRSKPCVVIFFG